MSVLSGILLLKSINRTFRSNMRLVANLGTLGNFFFWSGTKNNQNGQENFHQNFRLSKYSYIIYHFFANFVENTKMDKSVTNHQSINPFLLKSRGMKYCPSGKTPTY